MIVIKFQKVKKREFFRMTESSTNLVEKKSKYVSKRTFTEKEIIRQIRLQFPSYSGTDLRITKLFDERYSLNYWGKKGTKKEYNWDKRGEHIDWEYSILVRKVIEVEVKGDELKIVEKEGLGFNELVKQVK